MGKHKKSKSKFPKRSRPLPPHIQEQLRSHFQKKQAAERSGELDAVDMESDEWWDDLEKDDGFGCRSFEMVDFGREFDFNGSVLVDGVLLSGKSIKGSRSELPRLEDFASLEEYNQYHVREMLAAGIHPDDIDLDYVLPSFVEAMQLKTEAEIRSSTHWQRTVDQVGLEKAECMLRGMKPQIDQNRRNRKRDYGF